MDSQTDLKPHEKSAILEIAYRCTVMPVFLFDGLVPFMPEYDLGIDFILYRERDDLLVKVQQKGRWAIDRRYIDRNIGMLFPDGQDGKRGWYLVPHSIMMDYAREHTGYLDTASWAAGAYSVKGLGRKQKEHFAPFRLGEGGANANEAIYDRFRSAAC